MSCITVVSLLRDTGPNPGEQAHSRNVEMSNKRAYKSTQLNFGEQAFQYCKTFIHRFDSDRRLQNLNIFNSLRVTQLAADFHEYHSGITTLRVASTQLS